MLSIDEAMRMFMRYREGKSALERRIVENEQFYRLRHWDVAGRQAGAIEPASAWLFNSLAGKHADAMDNLPEATVLAREPDDEQEAQMLSMVLPAVLERCGFEQTYSDAWWYKLKNGAACYGVFWDSLSENGRGDIAIRKIDLLNLFWEPGITHLDDSPHLFFVSRVDKKMLQTQFPQYEPSQGYSFPWLTEYKTEDAGEPTDKVAVIDWYYKVRRGAKTILHYCKFVGDTVLFASEEQPAYRERGFYDHGRYPFILDVMYPIEGSPVGFGAIDLMRDPQIYIDKLNKIILTNAAINGKPRFFIKDNGAVNEEEFADWNGQPLIHVAGALEESNIRQLNVTPLDGYIIQHLHNKVDELKETSGNRDFNQGATSFGVTAASAIVALQEAGNRLSRDMHKNSYRAFRQICLLMIELIRQFYTEERTFRIMGSRFTRYSNRHLGGSFSHPLFDISIKAQKANPFSREAQNQLALSLFREGIFAPERAEAALTALELMEFEGKDKVIARIRQKAETQQQEGATV